MLLFEYATSIEIYVYVCGQHVAIIKTAQIHALMSDLRHFENFIR